MANIREEAPADVGAREHLLDLCFGAKRHAKTSAKLRKGRLPAEGLSLAAEHDGRLLGTIRLWHVDAGAGRPALLLGPLAVHPDAQSLGLGSALMQHALGRAQMLGHSAVLLVGDAPYYERFGFSAGLTEGLWLPGPFERVRFLGRALVSGALDQAAGLVTPTGQRIKSLARAA